MNNNNRKKILNSSPKTILFYIWIGFSTLSTVLSMASLLDSILAWSGFIRSLIEAYRLLVDAFWGTIFSLFKFSLPQYAHDYLTINSLLAISIAWGFYRTGEELGFVLASVRQFVKNNLFDFTLGGNSFELFSSNARKLLKEKCDGVSTEARAAIEYATREYPRFWLTIDGVVSTILLVASLLSLSFIVPFFLKWRDLRWNLKSKRLMINRANDLKLMDLGEFEKGVLEEQFESSCVSSTERDRQILELYHKIFRQSIIWYLFAVMVAFFILVFSNYFYLAVI